MIKIQNIEDLIPADIYNAVSKEAVLSILRDIAAGAEAFWRDLAGKELFSSRGDYLAGIQPYQIHGDIAILALVGTLPNMVERGLDKDIDLRDTLLGPSVPVVPSGQRGAHRTADGHKYRSIPFRHATPGSAGRVGSPMGQPYQGHPEVANAAKLGKTIYQAAKGLGETTSAPGQGVRYGERLKAGLAPKLKAHHATDIYAGMVKSSKEYAKATQTGGYTTFRTISTRKRIGWIIPADSPGYGRHLLDDVQTHVARLAPMAFSAYLRSSLGAP